MTQTKSNQISHYKGIVNIGTFSGKTSEAYQEIIPDMERYHKRCAEIVSKGTKRAPTFVRVKMDTEKLLKLRGVEYRTHTAKAMGIDSNILNKAEKGYYVSERNAYKISAYYRVTLTEILDNDGDL
jgi:hypothetical protein